MIIENVIAQASTLQKRGLYLIGTCPFHKETRPSLIVDPGKGKYTCLSCGATGDAYDFIARTTHSPREMVLQKYGEMSEGPNPEFDFRLSEINREAAEYYSWRLKASYGQAGLDYFHERGLSDETIDKFGLGYANGYGGHLVEHLNKHGYTEADLERAGLTLIIEGKTIDRFWDRVMFPLKDAGGNILGFTGRTLQKVDKVKYCNSPETQIFRKREILYGLDLACRSRHEYFILVEGNMDVISMHQAGFDNVVASCGTALTKEQCLLLRKYKANVLLMYDTDEPGVQSTKRAGNLLRECGFEVYCSDALPYKDPDEFLIHLGSSEMEKKIQSGYPFTDFLVRRGTPLEALDLLLHQTDPKRYERLIGG